MKQSIELWTDGSADPTGRHMGAGWVIRDDKGLVCEAFEPLMNPLHGNSNLAEVMAAARVLEELPRDANIKVHTDSQTLLHYVEVRTAPPVHKNTSYHTKKMSMALSCLFTTLAAHSSVTFVKGTDADPFLQKAHEQAQLASDYARQWHCKPLCKLDEFHTKMIETRTYLAALRTPRVPAL